jgi:hypothetical protein
LLLFALKAKRPRFRRGEDGAVLSCEAAEQNQGLRALCISLRDRIRCRITLRFGVRCLFSVRTVAQVQAADIVACAGV